MAVVAAIEGDMMVVPRRINRGGRGRYVFVAIALPEGVGGADVDGGMTLYPGGVESERVLGARGGWVFALFSKTSVMAANATSAYGVFNCDGIGSLEVAGSKL